MSIEVGNKLKGKVTGIKKFGAFVELPEGKSGLVHISEVADNYVENVEEHLSVGDEVDVKYYLLLMMEKLVFQLRKLKTVHVDNIRVNQVIKNQCKSRRF